MLTLNTALHAASIVICEGYEIEEFYTTDKTSIYRLICCDVYEVTVDVTQTIELDSDGCAVVTDTSGDSLQFEFRVSRPMTLKDI